MKYRHQPLSRAGPSWSTKHWLRVISWRDFIGDQCQESEKKKIIEKIELYSAGSSAFDKIKSKSIWLHLI